MKAKVKFCVLFAGAIGSSKTPIANFLSEELGLPIFNNDSIRTEVSEDFQHPNEIEDIERGVAYNVRRDERLYKLVNSGKSFILDASIDRRWDIIKVILEAEGYEWFIISLDLNKRFLLNLYKAKEYTISDSLDRTINDHKAFLKENLKDIGLHISDKNFKERMSLSIKEIKRWLNS